MPAAKVTSTIEDRSTRVQSNSTYNSAIVIDAPKGPINTPIKVTGQTDFLRRFTANERIEFGTTTYTRMLEAYKYLEEENGLYVVRAANTDDTDGVKTAGCLLALEGSNKTNVSFKDATEAYSSGLNYKNFNKYESSSSFSDEGYACILYASSPGVHGNDITVKIITDQERVKLTGAFIIEVYHNGVKKEEFTCSLDPTLKTGYGANCSLNKVLKSSSYIRGVADTSAKGITAYEIEITATKDNYESTFIGYTQTQNIKDAVFTEGVFTDPYCKTPFVENEDMTYTKIYTGKVIKPAALPKAGVIEFTKGEDGSVENVGAFITALKKLENMNSYDFQLIIDTYPCVEYHNAIRNLCNKRKNSCHGIISTPEEDEVGDNALNNILNYRKNELNINSYSMEMYTPHQLYYDEFNDVSVFIPAAPYVAALIMKSARERGWHWAVAGYNRGIVPSIDVETAFEESEVDSLSDAQVNTIIKDPGSGNVIWDELTLWNQAADLQDAHISRWVNIYLRPALEEMLKSFLFEFNDEETRNLIIKKIETFMDPQKSARACYAYRVICDESNNTDDDIENNRLNCWLFIKPTKIAKWITQKIILTPYSTNLEDLEI